MQKQCRKCTNPLLKYSDGLECHVIALRRSKMYLKQSKKTLDIPQRRLVPATENWETGNESS